MEYVWPILTAIGSAIGVGVPLLIQLKNATSKIKADSHQQVINNYDGMLTQVRLMIDARGVEAKDQSRLFIEEMDRKRVEHINELAREREFFSNQLKVVTETFKLSLSEDREFHRRELEILRGAFDNATKSIHQEHVVLMETITELKNVVMEIADKSAFRK